MNFSLEGKKVIFAAVLVLLLAVTLSSPAQIANVSATSHHVGANAESKLSNNVVTPRDIELYRRIMEQGTAAALSYYRGFPGEETESRVASERDIDRRGYQLLEHRRIREAIAVFRFNAAAYPESANAHHSLGEAYEENRQLRWARSHYATAVRRGRGAEDARTNTYQSNLDRVIGEIEAQKPVKSERGNSGPCART